MTTQRADAQRAWKAVLTPGMFVRINKAGHDKQLKPPFTLVAVAKESCDVFVSRYNPKPRSFEPDPIEKMIHGTKAAPIKPPILITLFGSSPNRYTVQGEINEAGEWAPYSER